MSQERRHDLESWLTGLPWMAFAAGTWLIAAIKGGVLFVEPRVSPLGTFPTPEDSLTATSYGLRTLAWVLRLESETSYRLLSAALLVLAIALITTMLHRRLPSAEARIAVILVATGSIGVALLGNVGRNDVFTIAGASILGIGGRRGLFLPAVGSSIMMLGNPEQSALASIAYLVCCAALPWRSRLPGAVLATVLTSTGGLALLLWARSTGVRGRVDFIGEYLGNSIYHYFHHWPLSLYVAYGSIWIIVLVAFRQYTQPMSRLVLAIGALALPGAVTAVTLDQTRVFVGISATLAFTLVTECVPTLRGFLKDRKVPPITSIAVACLLLPSIEITFTGTVRPAYDWLFTIGA